MKAYEVRETTGLDGLVLNSARSEPQPASWTDPGAHARRRAELSRSRRHQRRLWLHEISGDPAV